jgi:hypothetical protein
MSGPKRARIYLCSLFGDMMAERRHLHEVVAPRLQEKVAGRGVAIEFVDLRWGASSEAEAESADRLDEALQQVQRCRPFFVGLLGERYGPRLGPLPPEVLHAHPWLKGYQGASRLHLEVLASLLHLPPGPVPGLYYLRNPDWLAQVPEARRAAFVEDSPEFRQRLAVLKENLRHHGPVTKDYDCYWDAERETVAGLERFGEQVLADLAEKVQAWEATESSDRGQLATLLDFDRAEFAATLGEDIGEGPAAQDADFEEALGDEAEPSQPLVADENVQFSVYRPRVVQPDKWYPLLAFAHLAERPADAPPDTPDPLAEVHRQAQQVLGALSPAYHDMTQDSRLAVPREGEITFVPEVPGIVFNPPRRSFLWQEAVHREEFRLRAGADLDGQTARGRLTVFLGGLILADVSLSIRVDRTATLPADTPPEASAGRPYRKIFASYSHKDLDIVRQVEQFARLLGDEYLRDWTHLRAGEVWNERLLQMIEQADVFQLFWSSNSMHSDYVRQEWEHALRLNRPHFIRPTYWEEPMPMAPERDLPPEALRRLHFQRIFAPLQTHPVFQHADADRSLGEVTRSEAPPPVTREPGARWAPAPGGAAAPPPQSLPPAPASAAVPARRSELREEATERLRVRGRKSSEPVPQFRRTPGRSLVWLVVLLLGVAAAGLLALVWYSFLR